MASGGREYGTGKSLGEEIYLYGRLR